MTRDVFPVKAYIASLYGFALSLGGPGLFVIAFLDSSFVPLPQINDILVVLMVIEHKTWMPLYAGLATLGSVAGCYLLYYLAEKGGEKFLRARLKAAHIDGALALYRRYGMLTLFVPALLPPPAPFKAFVLMAGVAGVRPLPFVAAVGLARGVRYFALGILAVRYGDLAMAVMRTRGRQVALWVVFAILVAAASWVLWQRRARRA